MIKSKILVTGGAGFIGSHLTEALVNKGYQVRVFDNLSRNAIKFTKILEHENVEFMKGDILNPSELADALKGMDIVVHLAAIAGVSNYYNFPAKTLKVNLIGTYFLLEEMKKQGILRLIDMSTSECFGTDAVEVSEDSYFSVGPPFDKRWSYASSKIGGEQLIYRYAEEYYFNSTIFRPFNIYGPRQIGEGAISNFCKKILLNENLRIEGSGVALRSWCYIDDFITALLLTIENPHQGVECFNVGNPWSITSTYSLAEEVIKQGKEFLGDACKSELDFVQMNFTEIRVRYPKIDKMQSMYNWQPDVNLEQGIRKTLGWFLENKNEL